MLKMTLALVAAIVTTGCAPSVNDGLAAYQAKNYSRALEILANHEDDPTAQYHLAKLYRFGLGTAKNAEAAGAWYRRAADQGQADALLDYGTALVKGELGALDAQTGLAYLEQAGSRGQPRAYQEIGSYYQSRKGGEDGRKALDYYRKGANSIYTQLAIAGLFERGAKGVPANPENSLKALETAHDNPDPSTPHFTEYVAYQLAEYYLYGFGVLPSPEKSVAILGKYPDDPNTVSLLMWHKFLGLGTAPDRELAVTTWKKIYAEHVREHDRLDYEIHSPYLAAGLAIAYHAGIGTTKDEVESRKLAESLKTYASGEGHILRGLLAARGLIAGGCDPLIAPAASKPGRYTRLIGQFSYAVSECLLAKGELESALFSADHAREYGIKEASLLKLRIIEKMPPRQAAMALDSLAKYQAFTDLVPTSK